MKAKSIGFADRTILPSILQASPRDRANNLISTQDQATLPLGIRVQYATAMTTELIGSKCREYLPKGSTQQNRRNSKAIK